MTDMKENPFEEPMEFDVDSAELAEDPESNDSALANAEEELARHREAMLRMQAEMDNLRKRLMRDQGAPALLRARANTRCPTAMVRPAQPVCRTRRPLR